MIRGSFGTEMAIVRVATLKDVRRHEGKPDEDDRSRIKAGTLVVVRFACDGGEHLAYLECLKADGGEAEVLAARDAVWRRKVK